VLQASLFILESEHDHESSDGGDLNEGSVASDIVTSEDGGVVQEQGWG
jgi:hypothetical protein